MVDCTYSRNKFYTGKFFGIILKIWRRLVSTYVWVSMIVAGCLALFLVLLVAVCNVFALLHFSSELEIYPAMVIAFVFSIIFANVIIICNLAIVISVLEDVCGPQALLRSSVIIQGQTQVGLLIFLGSTIGMAFVEGLFEHRVKTLSYGDGSSRIWEGPLLVIMYSFVVLIDSMMSAVFYFACRSSSMEGLEQESQTILEATAPSSGWRSSYTAGSSIISRALPIWSLIRFVLQYGHLILKLHKVFTFTRYPLAHFLLTYFADESSENLATMAKAEISI
ncbi:hypothetical protein IFM89_003103 [Coptis chinensis]|uniref:Uncharacterized protein n=1 Tax=Coptis chinensis TaxID=261450 RepID=A0A835IVL7_9MAGN|nr:hypothetical protein IFM89_003103 [Coptis chinensis]